MDLKDFIKNVLTDINEAVDEAREVATRDIKFADTDSARTIEFDIAVSAEKIDSQEGKAGIKVLQFAEGGGKISQSKTNSTISRIVFGLKINSRTKSEQQAMRPKPAARNTS